MYRRNTPESPSVAAERPSTLRIASLLTRPDTIAAGQVHVLNLSAEPRHDIPRMNSSEAGWPSLLATCPLGGR